MRWAGALVGAAALVALAWWLATRGGPSATEYAVPGERHPYAVAVFNGTDIDGLARDVTIQLRRGGIDVVDYGTAPGDRRDSTVVLVRPDAEAAGVLVRNALGFGRVLTGDPGRYVDVAVILGYDARRPAPEP